MAKVAIHTSAPEFELNDYQGQPVKLTDFRGQMNVLLIFNRGFA